MSLFPVPVSGQQIPRGWFARLVRFMNSLFLRGDGSYLAVSHTPEGTFIRPTPYLIDQLNKAASAPASGGAAQNISATVSGNTASVTLSGSTSAVEFVGTGDVTLSGNTNGQIEISATGGSVVLGFPDYQHPIDTIYISANEVEDDEINYNIPVWVIGNFESDTWHGELSEFVVLLNNETIYSCRLQSRVSNLLPDGSPTENSIGLIDFSQPVMFPLPPNTTYQLLVARGIVELKVYPCISSVSPSDYTVTRTSGNTS